MSCNHRNSFKKAFTLAEILITLLIIGVIASIVVPNLINDSKKAEFVTKLQKEYAVLQQAYKLIIIDNGGSILNDPNFNCSGSTCVSLESANAMNSFITKINVVKNCGNSMGCWYEAPRKFLGGGVDDANLDLIWKDKYGKAILSDGTMIMVSIYNSNCTTTPGTTPLGSPLYGAVCGDIGIDINGALGPDQYGRDYFGFWITKTGIYPYGIYNDGYSCTINSSTKATSKGCAGKIFNEDAMNY